jgi:hypothetical protein
VSVIDHLAIVELRDSRAYPAPWWSWLLVNTKTHRIEGYYRRRHDAENELERRFALEETHA